MTNKSHTDTYWLCKHWENPVRKRKRKPFAMVLFLLYHGTSFLFIQKQRPSNTCQWFCLYQLLWFLKEIGGFCLTEGFLRFSMIKSWGRLSKMWVVILRDTQLDICLKLFVNMISSTAAAFSVIFVGRFILEWIF